MQFINITAEKGGVGATTTAVGIATLLHAEGHSVAIVDYSAKGDVNALMGAPNGEGTIWANGIAIVHSIEKAVKHEIDFDYIVIDNKLGTPIASSVHIACIANDYMSLRNENSAPRKPDMYVCLFTPSRVLSANDIATVLGNRDVYFIHNDADTARASDAGLFNQRVINGKLIGYNHGLLNAVMNRAAKRKSYSRKGK